MTEKILTRTEMIEELRLGPAKITFTKVNGDTRITEATLDTSRIPEKDLPKSHIYNTTNKNYLYSFDNLFDKIDKTSISQFEYLNNLRKNKKDGYGKCIWNSYKFTFFILLRFSN
jgi:hypothetical protein